jgi:hypothetical protein
VRTPPGSPRTVTVGARHPWCPFRFPLALARVSRIIYTPSIPRTFGGLVSCTRTSFWYPAYEGRTCTRVQLFPLDDVGPQRSSAGPPPLHSYWIPGVLSSNVVREVHCLFKAIEKEGLQGGKGDHNAVG